MYQDLRNTSRTPRRTNVPKAFSTVKPAERAFGLPEKKGQPIALWRLLTQWYPVVENQEAQKVMKQQGVEPCANADLPSGSCGIEELLGAGHAVRGKC